jgi:hypothetical protein
MNKADEIVIIISPKEHEGITAQQSLNIWNNLFIPKLGLNKVRAVIASSPSPITQTLDTIEADQDTSYLAVYGKGEESKYKNVGIDPRYKNGKAEDVGAFQNDNVDISATGLRAALSNNKDITSWMPDGITSNEYKQALGLDIIDEHADEKLVFEKIQGDSIICDNCDWTWKIKDGGNDLYICHKCGHDNTPQQSSSNNFFEPLQNQDIDIKTSSTSNRVDYYKDHIKNVIPSDFKVDKHKDKIIVSNITKKGLEYNKEFKDKLISLTMFMIDNDLNIEPLPNINFIEDDKENAVNILGHTAYYDPNQKCITLYTYGRHPKDVLRSYAHEMIHHKQNLEDRIHNIQGQNINEDDHLKELETEAYRDGNMYFRSWENSTKK